MKSVLMSLLRLGVAFVLENFSWVKAPNLPASLPSVSVSADVCFQAETTFNFSLLTPTL